MIKNWVKKAGYRFTSAKEEHIIAEGNQDAAADANGPARMDIDDDEKSEEKAQEAIVPPQEANANDADGDQKILVSDCYSQPGTVFHRKRSIVCMDEHGTFIRKKPRRNITFVNCVPTRVTHRLDCCKQSSALIA